MTDPISEPLRYEHGDLVLDRLKRKATAAGVALDLTAREFALLELLLAERGRVLTRDRIAQLIWEAADDLETNLIDVYVLRLRRKLAHDRPGSPLIHTIRGVGYMLE